MSQCSLDSVLPGFIEWRELQIKNGLILNTFHRPKPHLSISRFASESVRIIREAIFIDPCAWEKYAKVHCLKFNFTEMI